MANTSPQSSPVNLNSGALPTMGSGVNKYGGRDLADQEPFATIFVNEVNVYQFMRESDNGTGGFKYGHYLTSHTRERDFKERRNYSYYLNFFRRILNSLTKPIFREEPVRNTKTTNAFWDMFLDDCDRRGHSFNDFMKKIARKVKRYGVYFVVVDNDKPGEIQQTVAGAVQSKQYPYLYCYSPEDICDYKWDDLQRLEEVTFREWYKNKDGKKVWRYRTWTKTTWELFELIDLQENKSATSIASANVNGPRDLVEKKVIDSGVITIGEIPIIPIYDEEPDEEEDPILPHPPLYHIARANLAIYDVCSELRELERNQGFSLMVIPLEPGKAPGVSEIGTKNAIGFPKDATHAPAFISPDPAIPTALMADRKFLIEQMFEMAALVGIVGMVVKAESGRAKEWEFQSSREELTRFGHVMESGEEEIARLFGKYMNNIDMGFESKYSENYGLVDMTAETENTAAALALAISPEVNAEIKKDWVCKFFRDSKDELVQKLLDSVDQAALDEAQANKNMQDAALAAANGAGATNNPAPAPNAKPVPVPPGDKTTVTGAANGSEGGA